MSRLEKIVRPFQNKEQTLPRRQRQAYETEAEDVKLVIGKNSGGKVMTGSGSATNTLYMDTKLKEKKLSG